jgi:hypothetical protein
MTGRQAIACAAAAFSLAACAPDPKPAATVVAPVPQAYTCAQQQQAAGEFDALPAGAVLRTMITDYRILRGKLRAVLGLPEPAACPS